MTPPELITRQEARLIAAGKQAQELRRQLAITSQASLQIIAAMRALRAGIPLPNKGATKALLESRSSGD
ncbi:MAG: hypothetical protein R3227_17525 [Reinekea sp.]|nr:hypothetical protein [Reinekea sp.]